MVKDPMTLIRVPKGLEGVAITETKISKVDGANGRLTYRGYDATELARKLSFEEVAFLLWFGKIPSASERNQFFSALSSEQHLPDMLVFFLNSLSTSASPLSVLRTAVSFLGMIAGEKDSDGNAASARESGLSLIEKFPIIVSRYQRTKEGLAAVEPDPRLSHSANYIAMLSKKEKPDESKASALNSYLILLADHGMNASTFAARVAISTLTDVYSAVTAAIGTLKGPLHGGAPSQVYEMLQEIKSKDNASKWLKGKIERGERIMGFGHRIYRIEDPRSRALKQIAAEIADPKLFDLASTVEIEAKDLLRREHPERVLDTNVEFYSSLVLHAVGIPKDLFTPTFACARIVGWIAHIIEQLSDNRIFRPESIYVGPEGLNLPP